jgi:hypothetical protein
MKCVTLLYAPLEEERFQAKIPFSTRWLNIILKIAFYKKLLNFFIDFYFLKVFSYLGSHWIEYDLYPLITPQA